MRLRCDGIFSEQFVAHLLLSLMVKDLWKSVSIWQVMCKSSVSCFFIHR